jgi:hypothetical protein
VLTTDLLADDQGVDQGGEQREGDQAEAGEPVNDKGDAL